MPNPMLGKIDHDFSLKHPDFVLLVHLAQYVMQICSTFDPAQNADSYFWGKLTRILARSATILSCWSIWLNMQCKYVAHLILRRLPIPTFGKIDHDFSLKHPDFVLLVHLAQYVMQICSTFDLSENCPGF